MTADGKKQHAFEFLVHCLMGDVAHARVLHTLIETGFVSHGDLGISPEDVDVFQALSRIADPKERALSALRGCHEGNVLANFGVIQYLVRTHQILPTDLREGDDSMLKVGSDLIHFRKIHDKQIDRIFPREDPTQE